MLVRFRPAQDHVPVSRRRWGTTTPPGEDYQRYLDPWGDADLPIPEVLQAKARLAAL